VKYSTLRNIARPTRRIACSCNKSARPLHHAHSPGTTSTFTFRLPITHQASPRTVNISQGFRVAGAVGLGLGLGVIVTSMTQDLILFEPSPSPAAPTVAAAGTTAPASNIPSNAYDPDQPLPEPKGLANPYELTFGAVCGICAGVFIKKGLKATAFILGGMFVILQYFNSLSWLRVDWSSAADRFKQTFYTTTVDGESRPPTIQSAFKWLLNFVMADFQPRASFLAGLLLGLRVG